MYLKLFNEENTYFLEDKTKISTNPRMVYHKNNKEYIFKKDIFKRTCEISVNDDEITCAEIKLDKKVPPSLRVINKTYDLISIELLGIYYVMNLVY